MFSPFPELTKNLIRKSMLYGLYIKNSIAQVLGMIIEHKRVRVLLSDGGDTLDDYVFLGIELTYLYAENHLQRFSIVEISKYETIFMENANR